MQTFDTIVSMQYVKVTVCAGAKKEAVEEGKQRLILLVKEPAEKGLANMRARVMIAEHYGVTPKSVRLVKGHTQPHKTFIIDTGE